MTKSPTAFAVTLLVAGCGGSGFSAIVSAATLTPVPDVFACARAQLPVLGYEQTSINVAEHRVTARRTDESVRRADVKFRRALDELIIEVGARPTGETGLTVEAGTFSEYRTQLGFTLEQGPASDGAKGAAQAIMDQCGR